MGIKSIGAGLVNLAVLTRKNNRLLISLLFLSLMLVSGFYLSLATHQNEKVVAVAANDPIDSSLTLNTAVNTASESKTINLSLPPLPSQNNIGIAANIPYTSHTITIRPGDSLYAVSRELNIPYQIFLGLLKLKQVKGALTNLKAEHHLQVMLDSDGNLNKLRYEISAIQTLVVDNILTHPTATINTEPTTSYPVYRSGTIRRSFMQTAQKLGLTSQQIASLSKIFSGKTNLLAQARPGDQIQVLYSENTAKGQVIGQSPILLAKLILRNKVYTMIRFVFPDQSVGYFTPTGASLQEGYSRFPLHFSHVSSPFSPRRWHPLLHRFRAHEGVDLAANFGTPVHAIGDGRVVLRGRDGGYGNTVILQHGRSLSTLYAHLSRFVKQVGPGHVVHKGDVIGYVGSSGLATGPHLHYEVRINGIHRNPLTVPLPEAQPLAGKYIAMFKRLAKQYIDQASLMQSAA